VEGRLENNILIATEIDAEAGGRFRADDGEDLEIEGPVTTAWDEGAREFAVNGVVIGVNDETEFDDGLATDNLVEGALLQAEGAFRDGRLIAEEIEQREANAEVEARIGSVPDRENQTLIVGGVEVRVNSGTLIVDEDSDLNLGFEDLARDQFLEIEGIERSGQGFLEAVGIERDDDDNDFKVKGTVTGVDASSGIDTLTLIGVTIQVPDDTDVVGGTFEGISQGDRVEVEYQRRDGNFVATGIELEDD